MSAAAREDRGRDSFSLALGMAAPVEQLEAWFGAAGPRHRVIYASGVDAPRDAAGFKLARRWADEGKVTLLQQRDRGDPRKTNWIMERTHLGATASGCSSADVAAGSPASSSRQAIGPTTSRDHATRLQLAMLLDRLRWCALRGRACESDGALARELALGPAPRGRKRANYLVRLLEADGAIAVECRGRNAPRVVTILARGRGCGKTTSKGNG